MKHNKLREVLTVICISTMTASMGWAITTGILMGVTLAIIYYTPWDEK